ncbi:MAG: TonB terminal [Fibrobacteria bacterium]|jgi:TonB family protein|nr:TonB terminal [Fibrobacteria bacterium]
MPAAPAAPPPRDTPRIRQETRPPASSPRKAVIASALVHAALAGALVYVFWQPPRPARVEVFELVSLEPPKLRPLAPKAPEPPPPEPQVEPTRPPEAPKLTPTPKNPVAPSKPEPKKPPPPVLDTAKSLPVKEVARENSTANPVQVTNAPSNPRMSFWAGRVKAKIEQRWNPPVGIDVDGPAKTVVRFRVSLDGIISNVEITQSSGNKQLDDEATRAVKRTENLPPPRTVVPADFSEDFLQVGYEFIYKGQ